MWTYLHCFVRESGDGELSASGELDGGYGGTFEVKARTKVDLLLAICVRLREMTKHSVSVECCVFHPAGSVPRESWTDDMIALQCVLRKAEGLADDDDVCEKEEAVLVGICGIS